LGRDFGLHHALRGEYFDTLQVTKSALLDALRLQGLCRTSRRFKFCNLAVSIPYIFFDLFGP
jgi:hypothetical protein